MRYEKGHKEATRQRIIEMAAARFRRDGLEGVGVADIMAEAGLTHGGFYAHFKSKDDLIRQALGQAASESREKFIKRIDDGGLENWIRQYLRPEHRDHPEKGCTAAALTPELSRKTKNVREGYTAGVERIFTDIEKHLSTDIPATQRRQAAIGVFATVMGALQFARAVEDRALSDQILEAGIASALALARGKME